MNRPRIRQDSWKLRIGACVTAATLAGGTFGYVLRPGPGDSVQASAAQTAAGRRMHVALNMDPGDRRKAASLGYELRAISKPKQPSAPVLPFWGKPVVADEFTGGVVNPRDWVVQNAPEGRVNPTTALATRVKGGVVRFTGGLYQGRDLSGGIYSRRFQRYGRWEVRLRAAPGSGYAPGVFLWPERFGRPLYAEIDFAEIIDPTRRTVGLFLHSGPENTERQRIVKIDARRWHTYAVEWLPDRVSYLIDGRRVWNHRGSVIPPRGRMGLIVQNEQTCHRGPAECRSRATPAKVTMDLGWARIYRAPG